MLGRRRSQLGLLDVEGPWRDRLLAAKRVCANDDSPQGRAIRGNLLLVEAWTAKQAGDEARALQLTLESIAANEGNAEAHLERALLLEAADDTFAALQAASRACDLRPYEFDADLILMRLEQKLLAQLGI